jgi:hypothetical protein
VYYTHEANNTKAPIGMLMASALRPQARKNDGTKRLDMKEQTSKRSLTKQADKAYKQVRLLI